MSAKPTRPHRRAKSNAVFKQVIAALREFTEDEIATLAARHLAERQRRERRKRHEHN
ncbi:hypothetical protein FACS1894139_12020 [Planctomycetales bacterium]|nr:hypothetical protein FACS1894107_08920 [Planctomycetales bacterium]GHT06363.1 hypothetical protein FACS1894139_12020 [Planctomycetales bacterium]GHV23873.1 hypothetical protein AGMMS49959_18480 [Planctomycetales bacterium]